MVDMLINVFVPIQRFRCGAMGCRWEGNLRKSELLRRFGQPSFDGQQLQSERYRE
jgi:hypothetical protein